MKAPGLWELVSSNTVDDEMRPHDRRAPFTPTWVGAIGVIVLSLVVDASTVAGSLANRFQPCGYQPSDLSVSLIVMTLAALPAVRWLVWFVRRDERRGQAVVGLVVVVAGIALAVATQTALSGAPTVLCD